MVATLAFRRLYLEWQIKMRMIATLPDRNIIPSIKDEGDKWQEDITLRDK